MKAQILIYLSFGLTLGVILYSYYLDMKNKNETIDFLKDKNRDLSSKLMEKEIEILKVKAESKEPSLNLLSHESLFVPPRKMKRNSFITNMSPPPLPENFSFTVFLDDNENPAPKKKRHLYLVK